MFLFQLSGKVQAGAESQRPIEFSLQKAGDMFRVSLRQGGASFEVETERGQKAACSLPPLSMNAKFSDGSRVSYGSASSPPSSSFMKDIPKFRLARQQSGPVEGGQLKCEISSDAERYISLAISQANSFLVAGDFRAASSLLGQALKNVYSSMGEVTAYLDQNGGSAFSAAMVDKLRELLLPLKQMGQACAIVLSTYDPRAAPNANPLKTFESIGAENLVRIFGEPNYSALKSYLAVYERVLQSPEPNYSSVASLQAQHQFGQIEQGLSALRHDIVELVSSGEGAKSDLAEKWGIQSQSRFLMCSSLLATYSNSEGGYVQAVLADAYSMRQKNGHYVQASYTASDDRSKMENAYDQLAVNSILALTKERSKLANLAQMAGQNAIFGSPGLELPHSLRDSDPTYFALCQSASHILPVLGQSQLQPSEGEGSFLYDALAVRNLSRLNLFSQACVDLKTDASSKVSGLAAKALSKMEARGEMLFTDVLYLSRFFDEELSGQFASVARDMQAGRSFAELVKSVGAGNFTGAAESTMELASIYGRQALIIVSLAAALSSKSPSAKMTSEISMIGLAAWDIKDGEYLNAFMLLAGMYGGRFGAFGKQVQGMSSLYMFASGAKGAFESIGRASSYGLSTGEALDAATSVMMGLLIPAYHGYLGSKEMKAAAKWAAEVVQEYGAVPGSLGVTIEVPESKEPSGNKLARNKTQPTIKATQSHPKEILPNNENVNNALRELKVSRAEMESAIGEYLNELSKTDPKIRLIKLSQIYLQPVGDTNPVYWLRAPNGDVGIIKSADLLKGESLALPIYEMAGYPQGYDVKIYGKIGIVNLVYGTNMEDCVYRLKSNGRNPRQDYRVIDVEKGTYVKPDTQQFEKVMFQFGRQMYMHWLLALHDPHSQNFRIFLKNNEISIVRVDMEGCANGQLRSGDLEKAFSSPLITALSQFSLMNSEFTAGFLYQAKQAQQNAGPIAQFYDSNRGDGVMPGHAHDSGSRTNVKGKLEISPREAYGQFMGLRVAELDDSRLW